MSDTVIDIFISNMHINSRLFAGSSFLFTAALNNAAPIALVQLVILLLVLMNLQRGRSTIQHALKLLRWIVAPIILLHAFFTPGELIVSGMDLPISIEGLQTGFWFALHLTVIFFSAIVFSRLLSNREWVLSVLNLPLIGTSLLPYAVLMEAGWSRIKNMLHDEQRKWKEDGSGLRSMMFNLASLPSKAMTQSSIHADEVWNDWDHQVSNIMMENSIRKTSAVSTIAALICGSLLWYLYLSGGI